MSDRLTQASPRWPGLYPTAFGWAVMVLSLVSWLMAINYSNNLLYAVVCLWLALLLSSGIQGWLTFRRVRWQAFRTGELFAGQLNELTLPVMRQGFSGPLRLGSGRAADGEQLHWALTPTAPGWQTLQPPPLLGEDALGLWRFRHKLPALPARLVFARPLAHLPLSDWQQARSRQQENEDIAGLRDYRSGDAFRQIDWNASARRAALVSREWQGDQQHELHHLDWHALSGLSRDQRQQTLTAWVLELADRQQCWAMTLPQQQLAAAAGHAQRSACLHAIAEVAGETSC